LGITLPDRSHPGMKQPRIEYEREAETYARAIRDNWATSRDRSRATGRLLAWNMRRLAMHLYSREGLVCELVDNDHFELRYAGEIRRYEQPRPHAEAGRLGPYYQRIVRTVRGLYLTWDTDRNRGRMAGLYLAWLMHQAGLNTVQCGDLVATLLPRGWFRLRKGGESRYYREEDTA